MNDAPHRGDDRVPPGQYVTKKWPVLSCGDTTNLPLEDLLSEHALFADRHGGEPLAPDHGGPLRLVVPHLYAWKSAKWVSGIELLAGDERGFWEENGYHAYGDPWAEQRFSSQETRQAWQVRRAVQGS